MGFMLVDFTLKGFYQKRKHAQMKGMKMKAAVSVLVYVGDVESSRNSYEPD